MELFETTGQVELAEILFEGTRSKGCGVVQFAQVGEAETAIGKSCSATRYTQKPFMFRSEISAIYVWRPALGRSLQ